MIFKVLLGYQVWSGNVIINCCFYYVINNNVLLGYQVWSGNVI